MLSLTDIEDSPTEVSKMESVCDALAADFSRDNCYRSAHLSMTASENYPSKFVRAMGGAMQGAFYEFAPPYSTAEGEWHFPDSGAQAALVQKLAQLGCQMFQAQTFDWRPNGGAAAEQAVLLGTCSRGDAFVHFGHQDGGHSSLEELARKIGIGIFHIPVQEDSLLIDVQRLAELLAAQPEIKLVILDQSFKLRWQPLAEIREIMPPTVTLAYDASHDGGLILGGVLPQPLAAGADIVLGNTHKTIPGPQKGYVAFFNARHPVLKPVSDWICPYMQSNSHAELLVPFYMALVEISLFGRPYAQQIVKNAKALALCMHAEGLRVVGESFGYTETHQVLVSIGSPGEALHAAAHLLALAGIRCNNIEIPGSGGRHGLRFGVQALTRRGIQEIDMAVIARFIARVLVRKEPPELVRNEVALFLRSFPLHPLAFSLDSQYEEPHAIRLREEVAA
ncbi:hypothetical protein GT347_14145 [Xylophilus rhododendri]|uniref:Serine hydroxymethyltransferase-like domain-containing protein n=2 Tax=Xylophilus rhododendri TaxID=2697032 RepID=A0A857JEK3_9BURK|nr:hypothetical protein GT347_14145 [Xylophilus rhododendri]